MTVDWKKKLIPNLPYLLFVYLFDKLCQAVRLAPGLDASEKFLHLSQGFTEAFSSAAPSLHLLDLLAGIAGAIIVRLAVYAKSKNTKKYRKGIEYGSARWGTAADIAPYVDPVPDWNIPLTQTEKLTMSSRPKNPKYARNKNILVIGGSGSGKTRFFVKPSLMQMHSSYVVTDPKGQLLSEVGTMLRRGAPKLDENGKPMRDARGKVIYEPYRIKVLNTINFKKSMKYNPFAYIRSEKDILKLVNVIIANVKTKYVTLTIEAENLPAARARFARIETDTLNRFKVMGAAAHVLDGKERLELLYNILHPEGGQFAFEWDWLPASGLSVKDFISPSSFHFGETRTFRIGRRYGAVSFLQILAPEMHDRILTDFMEADGNIMVTMHIRGIRGCLQHKQLAKHQRKPNNFTDHWRSSADGKCSKGAAYFGRFVPVLFQRGL